MVDDGAPLRDRSDDDLIRMTRMDREGALGRAAVATLLERYAGRVHLWCVRYVRDRELAYDLAQDVMIRAYQGLDGFDGRAPFSAWLFVIVRNRCLRAVRKPSWTVDDDISLDELADPAASIETRIEVEEQEALVFELIDRHLSPLEREALMLRCVERVPVEEITRRLGIEHLSGARAILQNARRKLRAALARCEEEQ